MKKIAAVGDKNKWGVHRILYFLKNPAQVPRRPAGAAPPPAAAHLEVSHLCGRGRFDFGRGISVGCVNPYHCRHETGPVNKDRNYCRGSVAELCPHAPDRCIFTGDDGAWRECRNNASGVTPCVCGGSCYP